MATAQRDFRVEYGAHRASEGRRLDRASALEMPYLTRGPFARQWSVRSRTFDAFMHRIVAPFSAHLGRPLRLLDVGAGNAWLAWRAARAGHRATAVDIRDDDVDGLGASRVYDVAGAGTIERVVGTFDELPLRDASFDVVVFNASLHYAVDLPATLAEGRRMLASGGRLVILDSPFYERDADGQRMVDEKHRSATARFGDRAAALMTLPFIEYLTRDRLTTSSEGAGLSWTRHRVRYPMWYEMRPLVARLRGERTPSRFDLWEGIVA